jgi:formate dehydrogenase subunit gamma
MQFRDPNSRRVGAFEVHADMSRGFKRRTSIVGIAMTTATVAIGPALMSRAQTEVVLAACGRLKTTAGPLMPILHAVQDEIGFVPSGAVRVIARELNLSIADVHGVLTFYHYFRQTPGGRHVVHVCRAEACQAVGSAAIEVHAKRSLGIDYHGTTADGAIRLEPVYCLGNCALGPSIMIDDRLHGRVSARRFDELMHAARSAPEATP